MGATADALVQVVGDTIGDELVGQRPPLVFALEANDVEAIARLGRCRADLAGLKGEHRLLEFRRGLAASDLTKIAALCGRRAARIGLRERAEGLGALLQRFEHRRGVGACLREGLLVRRVGGEEDVRHLVNVFRAKPRNIVGVIPPTRCVVGLRQGDLALDHRAHDRFVVGLPPARLVARRFGRNVERPRPLQQQLPHDQRAGRVLPGIDRLLRRMVLHLAHDRVARDGDAVDADRHRLAGRDIGVDRAAHGITPPARRCAPDAGDAIRPRAHDLVAAPAEIPDRRAPARAPGG